MIHKLVLAFAAVTAGLLAAGCSAKDDGAVGIHPDWSYNDIR